MAVRGEEVASSIEAHVREAIEKMVGEIRSSVDDVRIAVDQQLKAALQSVQADVKSITFLPHITKAIGDLEKTYKSGAPVSAGADASRVKQAIQAVERGKQQVDVLNSLLEQCLLFGSRAALLILKGETFSGWKGVGFTAHGGNDDAIKRFNAAPGLIPELDHVLKNERVMLWDGVNLATRFGLSASEKAILVPMVIKDKVAAAVYVDAVGDDVSKLDPASIEILVFTTGLLVDTLAIRKKIPSPTLTDDAVTAGTASAARAAAPRASAPAAAPQRPVPATPRAAPLAAAPATSNATVAMPQLRDVPAPAKPAPKSTPAPTPAPTFSGSTPIPNFAGSGVSAPGRSPEDRPSTQYVPPSGANRSAATAASSSDDSKKHDEARRFARLLVSEIKLYNEAKVDQGRRSRDLYERLKEDIDRSRQMYDERIGEDVRKASNYFYDELVRILADGNTEILGL